jgi:predicted helicase
LWGFFQSVCCPILLASLALEWIMECYQITKDKASGIKNDPNDWCRERVPA